MPVYIANYEIMKKIILFTDSLVGGGAQRQLVGLAQLLKVQGYDVTVLTYHKNEFYLPFLEENNIKYVYLNKAENKFLRIPQIISYIRKEKPDTLIAYQETPSLIAAIAKLMMRKINVIVSERNTTQKIGLNEKVRFFLFRWVDKIVPNSYSQENFIKFRYPKLTKKIKTITNFVDIDKFQYVPKAKGDTTLIVVAATIFESKNTLGFIDALKTVRDRGLNFKVKWFGRSELYMDYLQACYEKIKKYNLEGHIELLDKTREIHKEYINADYVCLPSFYEGTPNVICEAMSCGRPIICSNICDNPIYVQEQVNGYLFNPTKTEEIANALQKAIETVSDGYTTLCKNSRTLAEEKLSKNIFIKKYTEII